MDIIEKSCSGIVSAIQEEWLINDSSKWYNYVVNLSEAERVVYLVVVLHNQEVNGGFDQYFSNGYGQLFAELSVGAYEAIRASKKAALISQALVLVKKQSAFFDVPWGKGIRGALKRNPALDNTELMAELEELDGQYYANEENIRDLLVAFCKIRICVYYNL
jgi:hypothetical protein